jgi:hypothetical protein
VAVIHLQTRAVAVPRQPPLRPQRHRSIAPAGSIDTGGGFHSPSAFAIALHTVSMSKPSENRHAESAFR